MAKTTINGTITVEFEYQMQFDENSTEFKEALSSYKNIIDPEADRDTMLKNVLYNVAVHQNYSVEGVGQIKLNGVLWNEKFPYSGIEMVPVTEGCEFEIKEVTNG